MQSHVKEQDEVVEESYEMTGLNVIKQAVDKNDVTRAYATPFQNNSLEKIDSGHIVVNNSLVQENKKIAHQNIPVEPISKKLDISFYPTNKEDNKKISEFGMWNEKGRWIYSATIQGDDEVAIPIILEAYQGYGIRHDEQRNDGGKYWQYMIHLYDHLSHQPTTSPHVMRCLGITKIDEEEVYYGLLLEKAKYGKLSDLAPALIKNDIKLTPRIITKWAYDLIRGLEYLHTQAKVPLGFATLNNVYITEEGAKWGDFPCLMKSEVDGISVDDKQNDTRIGVPFVAPETSMDNIMNAKSDVFIFGLLLCKMLNTNKNYDMFNGLHEAQILMRMLSGRNFFVLPENVPVELRELILRCTRFDPLQRPTVEEVKNTLIKFLMGPYQNIIKDVFSSDGFISASVQEKDIFTEKAFDPVSEYLADLDEEVTRELDNLINTQHCPEEPSLQKSSLINQTIFKTSSVAEDALQIKKSQSQDHASSMGM